MVAGSRGPSLTEVLDIPNKSLVLVSGYPGAGKTTFSRQAVLNGASIGIPVILVVTEQSASDVLAELREKGLEQAKPGVLRLVDAFSETVGLSRPDSPQMVSANCADLNSIAMAVTKLQQVTGGTGILLVLDSLTSPYILNGSEVVRFMRLFLSKFAAEGNSVLATVDKGCGRSEDLVAMMSISSGFMEIEAENERRVLDVVKHPRVRPTRIVIPTAGAWEKKIWDYADRDQKETQSGLVDFMRGRARSVKRKIGDHVNIFWPSLAFWNGILPAPKEFLEITYEMNKRHASSIRGTIPLLPWHRRLMLRLFLPSDFSKVKDMKKFAKLSKLLEQWHAGVMEYLGDASSTDEHYVRVSESFECCGFHGVGSTMATFLPPAIAGACQGLEKEERTWSAVETKCIGLGDPYCEVRLTPNANNGMRDSIIKQTSVVEAVCEKLMDRLMGFLVDGKPLVDRQRLGSDAHTDLVNSIMALPSMGGERYQNAWRVGGARVGKRAGEHLLAEGIEGDEGIRRIIHLLEHCNVGSVSTTPASGRKRKRMRIDDSCESHCWTYYTTKREEPSCFFTTGFLNGIFSTLCDQRVSERKCIATGDPYCEWEIQ